jgi:hypothetical protein
MNKKRSLVSFLSAFILIRLIPFISAYGFSSFGNIFANINLAQGWDQVIQMGQSFLTPLFQLLLNTDSGEFFFAKCIVLILLFVVIYYSLDKSDVFGRRRGVIFTISLIVSILAMRYIPETDFIKGILLPYGTLGAAILTLLPFIIYFFFVENNVPGTFGRRIAWAVYGLIFFFFMMYRISSGDTFSSLMGWFYIGGLVLVLICFLFDKHIHAYFDTAGFRGILDRHRRNRMIELREYAAKTIKRREEGIINDREYRKIMGEIADEQESLSKS